MKLSTKARYGVRFLLDLAQFGDGGSVPLKAVARRQAISEKYLWQVVDPLKKAGFVNAVAGPGGGYSLAKEPSRVTLLDMLTALDGACTLMACTHTPAPCPRGAFCAARELWRDVDRRIADVLRDYTLLELVERQRALNAAGAGNYAI